MITVTGADGTNKIIPERTRTCSNCRFLDIECVFVQSNRGGKRKKRDPDSTDLDPDIKKSKSLHLNQYDHEQSQASPPAQQQQQQQHNNKITMYHHQQKDSVPIFQMGKYPKNYLLLYLVKQHWIIKDWTLISKTNSQDLFLHFQVYWDLLEHYYSFRIVHFRRDQTQ